MNRPLQSAVIHIHEYHGQTHEFGAFPNRLAQSRGGTWMQQLVSCSSAVQTLDDLISSCYVNTRPSSLNMATGFIHDIC